MRRERTYICNCFGCGKKMFRGGDFYSGSMPGGGKASDMCSSRCLRKVNDLALQISEKTYIIMVNHWIERDGWEGLRKELWV